MLCVASSMREVGMDEAFVMGLKLELMNTKQPPSVQNVYPHSQSAFGVMDLPCLSIATIKAIEAFQNHSSTLPYHRS
jgi:hypothetical protein